MPLKGVKWRLWSEENLRIGTDQGHHQAPMLKPKVSITTEKTDQFIDVEKSIYNFESNQIKI
jgi:hypothetical protein